jgi:hypothetical protein
MIPRDVGLQMLENKVLSRGIIGKSAPILAEIMIRKSQVISEEGTMNTMSLPWNICVVTWELETPEHSELSNALLYGTEVIWVPAMLPVTVCTVDTPHPEIREILEAMNPMLSDIRRKEEIRLKKHQLLIEYISNADLPITIPQRLTPEYLFSQAKKEPFLLPILLSQRTQDGKNLDVIRHMQKARACIINPKSPYKVQKPLHWDADKAAQHLMKALSSVLLPDVSSLPLLEVMQLREEVKDEIEPMRAALFRLTEDLRKMVENEWSEEKVTQEATNLIKTRVEPFVREADQHARELLEKKWRRFFQGALKVIGLASAGWLRPDLTKDMLKEAVNVVAGMVSEKDHKELTGAAQFVLEVRRHYQEKYRY